MDLLARRHALHYAPIYYGDGDKNENENENNNDNDKDNGSIDFPNARIPITGSFST